MVTRWKQKLIHTHVLACVCTHKYWKGENFYLATVATYLPDDLAINLQLQSPVYKNNVYIQARGLNFHL